MLAAVLIFVTRPVMAWGDPTGAATLEEKPWLPTDFAWVILCGALVFFMQAGFAMVEAGFIRAKNVVNALFKGLMDFVIATLAFFLVGYALLMGKDWMGFIGTSASCC